MASRRLDAVRSRVEDLTSPYRIGAILTLSGVPGLYGPSCKACLGLAQQELNRLGGFGGRPLEFVFINGSRNAATVGRDVQAMLDAGVISALIGMHDSDVRNAVASANDGRVFYIYTPSYEGGHQAPGLLTVGETPDQHILPALQWLVKRRNLKRWYFIGNDYRWPRTLRTYLNHISDSLGISIVGTEFIEFSHPNYGAYLQAINDTAPDAVFLALVGDDAVNFNREFSAFRFEEPPSRFGPLLEENTLLAIGDESSNGIFTSGGYFPSLQYGWNTRFLDKYYAFAGACAPQLNRFSVACYEATHLLKQLYDRGEALPAASMPNAIEGATVSSIQGEWRIRQGHVTRNMFLAQASGNDFSVIEDFGPIDPVAAASTGFAKQPGVMKLLE